MYRNILVLLLLFLGLTASGGGICLIISPYGKLIGNLPLSILANSPFSDFFFPGLILFFILGIGPCFISYALIKKPVNRFAETLNYFNNITGLGRLVFTLLLHASFGFRLKHYMYKVWGSCKHFTCYMLSPYLYLPCTRK